jgi:hypothetical protein
MVGAIGCADGTVGTIDYQLSGGFTGMRTSVHIEPGGEMTRTKPNGSTDTKVLDPTQLAELHRKVDDAGFPTLEASYSCDCADDLVHTISVHIDGGTYMVIASSLAEYPDRLQPLLDALSSMTQAPVAPN